MRTPALFTPRRVRNQRHRGCRSAVGFEGLSQPPSLLLDLGDVVRADRRDVRRWDPLVVRGGGVRPGNLRCGPAPRRSVMRYRRGPLRSRVDPSRSRSIDGVGSPWAVRDRKRRPSTVAATHGSMVAVLFLSPFISPASSRRSSSSASVAFCSGLGFLELVVGPRNEGSWIHRSPPGVSGRESFVAENGVF